MLFRVHQRFPRKFRYLARMLFDIHSHPPRSIPYHLKPSHAMRVWNLCFGFPLNEQIAISNDDCQLVDEFVS